MSSQGHVKVSGFSLPSGSRGRAIAVVTLLMLFSSRREVLAPGSPLYDRILATRPTALRYTKYLQNGLFYFLFGAHTIETVLFIFILRKHGLGPLDVNWWKWMVLCFFGGKFCFDEFNEVVKIAKEKAL